MARDFAAAAVELVGSVWAARIAPPPRRSPGAWAEAERVLGTDEGPFPGPYSMSRSPLMREPMEAMSLTDPCEHVSLMGSAQIAKTQCPINLLGQIAVEIPCNVLVVLPSDGEARTWNRAKLQPMIDNTPSVRARIRDVKRADEWGSTIMLKRFPGGSIELVGANSSKGLQARTVRVVIMDEITEFPYDVDGRGDPVTNAETRVTAYRRIRKSKVIKVSTPGVAGRCRIAAAWEAGSQGIPHVPCPDCGEYQPIVFSQIIYETDAPELARYACAHCGSLWREGQKRAIMAAGVWVHAHPERLPFHKSFRIWAGYSEFVTWAWIAQERERTRHDAQLDKVFSQQVLCEPYEQKYDTVPHQILWQRRTPWDAGTIPAGVLFLTGATDVQGDRLVWGVYGFDRDFGQYWIDGGILAGDPAESDVWHEHDQLIGRKWVDAWGRERGCESWGIDAGYMSQHVYRYARSRAQQQSPRVMALDGRSKWGEPPVGQAKPVDINWQGRKIGAVLLWPVGTWDIKAELITAMGKTERGPNEHGRWPRGAMRFPDRLDMGFFEELTAEAMVVRHTRAGYEVREWIKVRSRNEEFDIAVYTRALARQVTAGMTAAAWDGLIASRAPDHSYTNDQTGIVSTRTSVVVPPHVANQAALRGRAVTGTGRRVL